MSDLLAVLGDCLSCQLLGVALGLLGLAGICIFVYALFVLARMRAWGGLSILLLVCAIVVLLFLCGGCSDPEPIAPVSQADVSVYEFLAATEPGCHPAREPVPVELPSLAVLGITTRALWVLGFDYRCVGFAEDGDSFGYVVPGIGTQWVYPMRRGLFVTMTRRTGDVLEGVVVQ